MHRKIYLIHFWIKNFYDAEAGLTPPSFNVTDPILMPKNDKGDYAKGDSKFWGEAQHWLDSFVLSKVRKLPSLTVEGRVTIQGAEYIGDVEILNRLVNWTKQNRQKEWC